MTVDRSGKVGGVGQGDKPKISDNNKLPLADGPFKSLADSLGGNRSAVVSPDEEAIAVVKPGREIPFSRVLISIFFLLL